MQSGDRYGVWTAQRQLGEGGGGEVWLCAKPDGVRGALKVLGARSSREDRARIVREIRALERLDHPAVVRILDHGFGEGAAPWLVMEYLEGQDLEKRLAAGPIPVDECLGMFHALTDGLAQAHAKGIQHRDIKSANIVLQADGRAKLVDFGAAIESDATGVTKAGMVLGTFAYMAPEVLTGGDRDPVAGDIYAIGQLLVEALTGAPLFRGAGEGAAWHEVVADKLEWDALDPGAAFDPALRKLARLATALDPDDRLKTMDELRDKILEVIEGRAPEPTPAPAERQSWRAAPKSPAPAPRHPAPPAANSPAPQSRAKAAPAAARRPPSPRPALAAPSGLPRFTRDELLSAAALGLGVALAVAAIGFALT